MNIVPLEVPRPKTLGACGPSGLLALELPRENINQYTPSAFPHIVSMSNHTDKAAARLLFKFV